MNNKEFIAELSEKMQLPAKDAQRMVKNMLDSITTLLEEGNDVSINGFGTFDVKKRNDRVMVHPVSGAKMLVPPKLVLNFKQSATFKEQMREEKGVSDEK
ncbi:MAG: HU family DNA-binding protein [Bacteroidaceae bacterium]|nr:HU family DNA-binding protein [Bacteroidaceae bacterium]